jgi:hypothetical protein
MTVRAPTRRDHVAVVSAQPVLARRLLRQSTRFAVIAFVRPWRYCDARNGGGLRQSTSERRRRSYRHGSATRPAPRSCSASIGDVAALYDYACPNNGGLTSIAGSNQERGVPNIITCLWIWGQTGAIRQKLALFARPAPPAYGLDRMSPARLGLDMQVVEFNNDISRTPIGLR